MFHFNPDAKDNTIRVFHGTRAPADIMRKEGLRYPGREILLQMIRKSMEMAGLSYDIWFENQLKMRRNGKLCILEEFTRTHRSKIWVTDSEQNAWSYASRSPEIVTEAIRNEFTRLHARRKNVFRQANEIVKCATSWIGNPTVVVLDAKIIDASRGCNQPIGEFISPESIVTVLESPRS